MDELIGPCQSRFILGRGTRDNTIIAHYMHKKRGNLDSFFSRLTWKKLMIWLIGILFSSTYLSLVSLPLLLS